MKSIILPKKNARIFQYFAICAAGLDDLLKKEIESLPAKVTHHYPGGVEFEGNLEVGYLACLSLRVATRVLLKLKQVRKIFDPDHFYQAVRSIDWPRHFDVEATFAVYVTESKSKERRARADSQYLALKAKDAIADCFRDQFQKRPNVDRKDSDVTIRIHWHDDLLKIYIDLSGPSLHERGYRTQSGVAPLKETLAAALLYRANWPELAKQNVMFLDPFCGSGTLLIEAAMMASDTAPGLYRQRFGFFSWPEHDAELFESITHRLQSRRNLNYTALPKILGSDRDPHAVALARSNVQHAEFQEWIQIQDAAFETTRAPAPRGLIVTNPPYGIRLEETRALQETYQRIGSTLKHHYPSWQCGVISSDKKLIQCISLRPSKKYEVMNGGLESYFFIFIISDGKMSES